jgi:hypothetical protein
MRRERAARREHGALLFRGVLRLAFALQPSHVAVLTRLERLHGTRLPLWYTSSMVWRPRHSRSIPHLPSHSSSTQSGAGERAAASASARCRSSCCTQHNSSSTLSIDWTWLSKEPSEPIGLSGEHTEPAGEHTELAFSCALLHHDCAPPARPRDARALSGVAACGLSRVGRANHREAGAAAAPAQAGRH